jgi:hypothetical protein
MIKILAALGAFSFVACGVAGAAFAQSPYSPPLQAPAYRYELPAAALAERSALPSGLVYEGRSVHVRHPAAKTDLPETPAFPAGLPLNLEPKPRPSSSGASFQTQYASL